MSFQHSPREFSDLADTLCAHHGLISHDVLEVLEGVVCRVVAQSALERIVLRGVVQSWIGGGQIGHGHSW